MAFTIRNKNFNFGPKIRDIRKQRGLTIKEVSKKSGVSQSYWSQLERQHRDVPSIPKLNMMARGLDISNDRIYELAGIKGGSLDLADAIDGHSYMTYHGRPVKDSDLDVIKRILATGTSGTAD